MWYFDDPIETGWPKHVIVPLTLRVAQYVLPDSDVQKVYIGRASGESAIKAMKRRYNSSTFEKDINVFIALYESSSELNCGQVRAVLVEIFKRQPKVINVNEGTPGRSSSAQSHYVFVGFKLPSVYYWDNLQSKRSLKNYVKRYLDKERVKKVYIGIASGDNDRSAMRRRYDEFKREEGINEVIAIYETSDDQDCRDTEKELVDYSKTYMSEKVINRRSGGSGRPSSKLRFYVYLALRWTPAGHDT